MIKNGLLLRALSTLGGSRLLVSTRADSAHQGCLRCQSIQSLTPCLVSSLWPGTAAAPRSTFCVYLEGLLRRLTGPYCNQVGPGHAAETLQMQSISHRDCGDGVVLRRDRKTRGLLLQSNFQDRLETARNKEPCLLF